MLKIYDADIRKLLYKYFLTKKEFSNTSTFVINEMDICANSSRVDIAVINKYLYGFEIKSKQDSLERLPSQIIADNKTFDFVTIVAFESHLPDILKMVPEWWGIIKVFEQDGNILLQVIREGEVNLNSDIKSITRLLWKDEMIELLKQHTSLSKINKNKSRNQLSELIVNNISKDVIKQYVCNTLTNRTNWRITQIQSVKTR